MNELEHIAPLLAKTSQVLPYTIPKHYFESFSDDLLERIRQLEMNMQAPEGYFESLPGILLDKIRALEQEDELDQVAPLLKTISRKPVQFVPGNYFEEFNIRLQEHSDELEGIAPLLNTIGNQPVQFVPAGYFENFSMVGLIEEKETAKIRSISFKKTWIKYSVAASVAGLLVFTGLRFFDKDANMNSQPPILASVNISEELLKVQDSTIVNYLKNTEPGFEATAVAYHDVNNEDIQGFLKEFSEEELQQYLKQEGEQTINL